MACETAACSECAKNCMLIHKKMEQSAAPTSFFKVMFGSGFSERLFLPPKFAPKVSSLVDQKIHLEDIKGRHWDVYISNCDGSFAIEEGWSGFSLDHGLELGDFLLFHYLSSYFVVKIYDKTGCEKSDFPWSLKDNKQSCTDRNSLNQEDLCYSRSNDGSSINQCSSSSIVSRTNVATVQSEKKVSHPESVANDPRESTPDIIILDDLCKESTQKVSHGSKKSLNYLENSKSGLGSKKHKYQNLHEDVKKNLKGEAIQAADKGLASTSQNPYHYRETINDRLKVQVKKEPVELTHSLSSLIKTTLEGRGSSRKDEHLQGYDMTSSGYKLKKATAEDVVGNSSWRADTVKVMISGPSQLVHHQRYWNHSSSDTPPPLDASADSPFNSLFVPIEDLLEADLPIALRKGQGEPFADSWRYRRLELPTSLPSAFSGGRISRERRLVFLEDPTKRIWPVLYEERPEFSVLANGWDGFVKANDLQPGDECIFQHRKDSTYTVSISRKREKLALSIPIQ